MFVWKYFGFVVDEFSKREHTVKSLGFRHLESLDISKQTSDTLKTVYRDFQQKFDWNFWLPGI